MSDDYYSQSSSSSSSGGSESTSPLLKNPVFWISIATISVGLVKYVVSYMLKSKCSDFSVCWGLLKIKRDITIERDIEIAQINAGKTDEEKEDEVISIQLPGSRRPSKP